MTELGTCDNQQANVLHRKSAECINWKPGKPTPRVEIWRADERTLTVARTDGACWNGPDNTFTNIKHNGVWDSQLMRFVDVPEFPDTDEEFSDGTPVALYEGLEPNEC